MKKLRIMLILLIISFYPVKTYSSVTTDTINTSNGKLIIHFIGHGSLIFEYNNKIIHIDPFAKLADYSQLPKADLVMITHHHMDHFDVDALQSIQKDSMKIIYTEVCKNTGKFSGSADVMKNGDTLTITDIFIEAVPAYNILNKRSDGNPYHQKGEGNGYIITFGDKRVYVAGDTENIPEMKGFGHIDIAFIPMNLPYTMSPELAADAARMLKPKILYPYHFGNTDTSLIINLLKDENKIEIRIRDMK